jgi:hypothetical protein
MGLFRGAGARLQGLFGNDDLGDAFSQARAFLDGDYGTGIDIAARRFRRGRPSGLDQALKQTGSVTGADPGEAAALAPPIGAILHGHRYLGGDPGQEDNWQPLGAGVAAANGVAPADFGSWN